MIFVTADSCRSQLEGLTQLLVSVFPGSTIYQHSDMRLIPRDVLNRHVDAVFLEKGTDKTNALNFVKMLRRQKSDIAVFLISQTEELREEAIEAGASGCLIRPITEQQLRDAMCFSNK